MKLDKWIFRLMNLLLSASLAFAVLVLLERMFRAGWPWYSRALGCWPILLCFLLGLLGRALPGWKYRLLPLSLLPAAGLLVVSVPGFSAGAIILRVVALALGAGLYLLGLRGDEPFPGKLAIGTLLVYLLICALHAGEPELSTLCWCALASFLLALYSFNAASLYTGVHNVKGGETMAIPAGIRSRNLLLLTLFLLLCLLLGSLSPLRAGLGAAWQWIWGGVLVVIRWLGALGTTDKLGTPTPTPTEPEPQETFDMSLVGEDGSGIFVTVYGILLFIGCVVFFLMAYGLAREGKGGGALRRLSDALRKLFRTRQILEYEDDVERLVDLKTLMKQRTEKARRLWKKATTRARRFTDMPDDRSRVRYVYRALLRSKYAEGWTPATTPGELGEEQEREALRRLTEEYSQVRYDPDSAVPPDFGRQAAEALRELKSR